jgi:hypothetical protein
MPSTLALCERDPGLWWFEIERPNLRWRGGAAMVKQERPTYVSGDLRSAALLSLRRRHGFENHVVVYLIVNLAIWLTVGAIWDVWFPWSLVPAGVWGIGLAFHAWFTFGPPNQPITEDEVEREVVRLASRRGVAAEDRPEWDGDYWASGDARTDSTGPGAAAWGRVTTQSSTRGNRPAGEKVIASEKVETGGDAR